MSTDTTVTPIEAPASAETASESNTPEQTLAPEAVVADLKDQVANGTPKEKAEAKKSLKQLKVKYNGKEYLEDLPFEIPDDEKSRDYMTRQIQMSKLAQNKSQEYSSLEKEVRSFVEELKKNPRKVLADPSIGIDIKQLAAQVIEEEIANSQKSPEQLEKEKLENELKELKAQREKESKDFNEKELQRLQDQEYERYDMLMTQALEKSDLPKSPYVVKKMADYMLMGIQKGLDVTPEDVLPLVRDEMTNDLKEMFALMPDEVVEAIVGKDVIGRIRKKSVSKAKQTAQTGAPIVQKDNSTPSGKEKSAKDGKRLTYRDFFGT